MPICDITPFCYMLRCVTACCFGGGSETHQITPTAQGGAHGSVRLLLTPLTVPAAKMWNCLLCDFVL